MCSISVFIYIYIKGMIHLTMTILIPKSWAPECGPRFKRNMTCERMRTNGQKVGF